MLEKTDLYKSQLERIAEYCDCMIGGAEGALELCDALTTARNMALFVLHYKDSKDQKND